MRTSKLIYSQKNKYRHLIYLQNIKNVIRDRKTGESLINYIVTKIRKSIVLPSLMTYEQRRQSGLTNIDRKQIIIDQKDGEPKTDSEVIYNNRRYLVKDLERTEDNKGFILTTDNTNSEEDVSPLDVTSETPSSVSDLEGWYDASDTGTVTLSGSDVTDWDDKSGNSNDFTEGSSHPTYTSGVSVDFTSSQRMLNGSNLFDAHAKQTIFIVVTISSFIDGLIFGQEGFALESGIWSDSIIKNIQAKGTSTFLIETTQLSATKLLITVQFSDTGRSMIRVDGEYYALNSREYPAFSGSLSTQIGDDGSGFSGSLHEIAFYSRILTDTEILQLEKYFANKWSVDIINQVN